MANTDHPGPWGSPLWDHLETIRTLRMQRKTWKQIAEALDVETTPRAVRNFFVRSRNPKRKVPAGLEDTIIGGPTSVKNQRPAAAPNEESSTPEKKEELFERMKSRAQEKPKSSWEVFDPEELSK